jgi:hypothetical protein
MGDVIGIESGRAAWPCAWRAMRPIWRLCSTALAGVL